MPHTIEEAAVAQDKLYTEGIRILGEMNFNYDKIRYANLKEGYRQDFANDFEGHGVVDADGKGHDWKGVWLLDGRVLLCQTCWSDGT